MLNLYINNFYHYIVLHASNKHIYSPPKKRYNPVVTINESFPICINEFELVVTILTQEVVFPSVNTFADDLEPVRLCFVVLLYIVLSVIESITEIF